MELLEAIKARHSVRSYQDKPLSAEIVNKLKQEIDICNQESGLHMQLVINEPNAFDGLMAHYGKFSGVKNYLAIIGKRERMRKKHAATMESGLRFMRKRWA